MLHLMNDYVWALDVSPGEQKTDAWYTRVTTVFHLLYMLPSASYFFSGQGSPLPVLDVEGTVALTATADVKVEDDGSSVSNLDNETRSP